MKKFILNKEITANQLISLGLEIEFDLSNSRMKLRVSDKKLEKYGPLVFQYGHFPEDIECQMVVKLYFDYPIDNYDSPIKWFEVVESESRVFKYFIYDVLPNLGITIRSYEEYKRVVLNVVTCVMSENFIPFKQDVFLRIYKIFKEMGKEFYFENYLFSSSDQERLDILAQLEDIINSLLESRD